MTLACALPSGPLGDAAKPGAGFITLSVAEAESQRPEQQWPQPRDGPHRPSVLFFHFRPRWDLLWLPMPRALLLPRAGPVEGGRAAEGSRRGELSWLSRARLPVETLQFSGAGSFPALLTSSLRCGEIVVAVV